MTLVEILEATDRLRLSDKLILLGRLSQLIRRELEPTSSLSLAGAATRPVNELTEKITPVQGVRGIESIQGQHQNTNSSVILGSFTLPLPEEYLTLKNSGCEDEVNRKYGYGSLTGKLIVPDDFNEPLEDFQDYM